MLNNMKVFQFKNENEVYGIAAKTQELAISYYIEELNHVYEEMQEIPESEWDKKIITMWEDNDTTTKPYKVSIREIIIGNEAQIIFSNVMDF